MKVDHRSANSLLTLHTVDSARTVSMLAIRPSFRMAFCRFKLLILCSMALASVFIRRLLITATLCHVRKIHYSHRRTRAAYSVHDFSNRTAMCASSRLMASSCINRKTTGTNIKCHTDPLAKARPRIIATLPT